jgi:23S rRNA (uridine2552-2'-O)-methyltransferase
MTRAQPDAFYRRAKKEGYAARSVYKLAEMDRRYQLLRRGQAVLDLGCHPGSWLQYAAQKVGPRGLVVGVDMQPLAFQLPANARFVQADLLEINPIDLRPFAPEYDLVLSDAAPRTTGVTHADVAQSLGLAAKALELARGLLKPRGTLVVKVYYGTEADGLIKEIKAAFEMGKGYKPSATKAGSKETYILGRGLKPAARLA